MAALKVSWREAWRIRRVRKRLRAEATHLIGEARRIIKKRSYRIPSTVSADIEAAVGRVQGAMPGVEIEPLREALSGLDAKMDEHLAFARKSTLREYAESIGVAVGIALLLRAFVVEAFQIPSGSMIPTLQIGDHIFVSKFSYGVEVPFTDLKVLRLAEPKRGDVIVFKYPLGPETDYIKRVVALPGDTIEIRRNELFINGRPMPRELQDEPCHYQEVEPFGGGLRDRDCRLWREKLDNRSHWTVEEPRRASQDFGPKEIPPEEVFVMGDNRDNSNDSRVWGTVPYKLIKGRALIVWWSRGPIQEGFSLDGVQEWFQAVRWRRFFHAVQ
jgi:signal peptidase I